MSLLDQWLLDNPVCKVTLSKEETIRRYRLQQEALNESKHIWEENEAFERASKVIETKIKELTQ